MTLQQLRYVTAVAGTGTISHAVQQFYISQPSLTNAIRELEQEVGLALSKTESSVVSQTLLEYLRSSRQRKDPYMPIFVSLLGRYAHLCLWGFLAISLVDTIQHTSFCIHNCIA